MAFDEMDKFIPERGALADPFNEENYTESIKEELDRRFDAVIGMNDSTTVSKGDSVATYGLGGCIGGYIDNADTNTFFHYEPAASNIIECVIGQHCSQETRRLHLFVPGDWHREEGGKYTLVPKEEYKSQYLASVLSLAEQRGVDITFHGYALKADVGDRYHGTAWVDKEGNVYNNHIIVSKAVTPSQKNKECTP